VADSGSKKKVANGLVALSSAAVMAVYGAGYARTRAAADRFAQQAAERHARAPLARGDALSLDSASPVAPVAEPLAAAATGPSSPPDGAPATGLAASPAAAPVSSADVASSRTPAREQSPAATAPTAAAAKTDTSALPPATTQTATAPAATAAAETATAPAEQPPAAPAPVAVTGDAEGAPYKDGTYYGWGSCRHGDIQAAVVIEGGRMASATVAQCLTRYACSWIDPLLPHTVRKQAATADYVSGATESSEAFNDAVSEALLQAH
jgi:uncharacterized protein with FMN-binding domain